MDVLPIKIRMKNFDQLSFRIGALLSGPLSYAVGISFAAENDFAKHRSLSAAVFAFHNVVMV